MVAYKNYNIWIKGRVQDIGFRNLVENIARSLNLRGMVYNDLDGTVKIVCGGTVSSVRSMIEELKDKSVNIGVAIDKIDQEEITGRVDLPPYFFKAPTDELSDIGMKLDVGVQSIQEIEKNTGAISAKNDALLDKTDGLLDRNDALVEGQNKMIKLLERIAEK
ncbi:MAG: acylphosphatase [Candidatus Hydrothermarchaeaceae archaeon]